MKNTLVILNDYGDALASLQRYAESNGEDSLYARELLIKRIRRVINNELTKHQRQVIEMYYFENLNTVEIAKILNIDKSNVCRAMKRARSRIEKILKYSL